MMNCDLEKIKAFLKRAAHPVFLFDLDGTIVFNNEIDNSILEHINRLKEKGVLIGIATGRTYMEARKIIQRMAPNAPSILNDGKIIYEYKTHTFSVITQLYEKEYFQFKKEIDLQNQYVEEYFNGYRFYSSKVKSLFRHTIALDKTYLPEPAEGDKLVNVYIALGYLQNCPLNAKELIEKYSGKNMRLEKYGNFWLKISGKKTDKSNALGKAGAFLPENIAYFGDGKNDFNIMQKCHLSVVVPNSDDCLLTLPSPIIVENTIIDVLDAILNIV